jgi:hypothetical protein
VISSLAKQLEKPPFSILYTSFGVWPRDHYMPLQRFTTGVSHALLWFSCDSGPCMWTRSCSVSFPHTTEQDSQSTPNTWSLADSSMSEMQWPYSLHLSLNREKTVYSNFQTGVSGLACSGYISNFGCSGSKTGCSHFY